MELAEAHISYPRHKSNSLLGLSLILLAHRTFYISLIKFNSHLTIYREFKKEEENFFKKKKNANSGANTQIQEPHTHYAQGYLPTLGGRK